MPLFYLDVINGSGLAPDEEGLELADLDAARSQAIKGIRSVIADEARRGVLDLRGRIEISDADRKVLAVVPYTEAFDLRTGGAAE